MEFWRVPLDVDEIQITRGIVYIIENRCKGCGYCIQFCPRQILEFSPKFNQKGYHPPVVKNSDECVNCHYCEIICPEFAIYSVEVSDSYNETEHNNEFNEKVNGKSNPHR